MSIVTRGLGKRSGMVATWGLGRRDVVGVVVDVLTTVFSAPSRAWEWGGTTRGWSDDGVSRLYSAATGARQWALTRGQRAWEFVTSGRSWLRSKVRVWLTKNDRSWDE